MPASSQTHDAVVVGARGFIGRALSARLEEAGIPTTRVGRGDLAADSPLWPTLASAATVYWAASSINPAIAASDPDLVAADRQAFGEALTRLDGLSSRARVVLFSSGGTVYGPARPPFTEETPARPSSAYGLAKLALEQDLAASALTGVAVRIANAYGPGQQPAPGQGVIGHWLRALARHEPIKVFGDLAVARDYLYIDDLVDALVLLHGADEVPPVLNLGSGRPTTLEEILATIETVSREHPVQVEHSPARSFDLERVWLDSGLAQRLLGWEAATRVEDGILSMWQWIREVTERSATR